MSDIAWKGERISRFVLGTAQLGMNYGIANVHGQPSEGLACEIVKTAVVCGVNCVDTAQAYGNSEVVLGRALRICGAGSDIKVVSKLSPDLQPTDGEAIGQSIENSCQNLGVEQLWGLMLHRPAWLDVWGEGLGRVLSDVVRRGWVKYLGVSACRPDEARKALENPDIQIVQVPCNLWDQRMLQEGIFDLAKKKDKLCFVRSIYLQGLLLLPPEKAAEKLPVAKKASQTWHKVAAEFAMGPGRLSIRFGLSLNVPVVIGAESVRQTEDNSDELNKQSPLPADIIAQIYNKMSPFLNEHIINPTLWRE